MTDAIALIQAGQLDRARHALTRHLAILPDDVEARRLLGRLLLQLGDPGAAMDQMTLVARQHPGLAEIHFEIGVICLALAQPDEAAAAFRQELAIQPDHSGARFNLGWALRRGGADEEALTVWQRLVAAQPGHGQAWFNIGNILMERDDVDGAAQAFQTALPLMADRAAVLLNLGSAWQRQGRLEDAKEAFQQILRITPDHAQAANNLGNVLTALGRLGDAIIVFESALVGHPDDVRLLCNLALALNVEKSRRRAATLLERAVALDPLDAWAWNCLGAVQSARSHLEEARESLGRALALDPAMAEAHSNLGVIDCDLGQTEAALEHFRRAHDLAPEDAAIHSNLLFLMRHMPNLDPRMLYEAHRRFGEIQERRAAPVAVVPVRPKRARLRVGYVSPDFRDHAVTLFFEPVLRHHDRSHLEIFCYHTATGTDAVTERLKSLGDTWRNVAGLPPDEAARLIREDGVDILVDLAGHSAGNGLPIFARKPAPIQMTWLGYPGTTGLTRMDYRITDPGTDPPGRNDAFYTETLLYLPGHSGFHPPVGSPDIRPPPVLSRGSIRFGSFNKPVKINAEVIAVWSAILAEVADSTLLMVVPGGDQPVIRDKIRAMFIPAGVAPDRIDVVGNRPLAGFLELVAQADIALDSFPYSGATTTMLTLWMGVPVICMEGRDAASSVSRGVLLSSGAGALIARTSAEYQAIARDLAASPRRLAELRPRLRRRMEALTRDTMGEVAIGLEGLYASAWSHLTEGTPLPDRSRPRRVGDSREILARHGAMLAVAVHRDGRSVILLVDGTGCRPVGGPLAGDQITPRFSPDGRRLAFSQNDGRAFQIVLADLERGGFSVLTGDGLNHTMPAWDGGGRRLVWTAIPVLDVEHGNLAEIHCWDGDGPPRRLTDNDRMDCYPLVLPDGSGVVYESGRADGLFGVFRADWQGNETAIVYQPDAAANGIPDVAPDGRVVFERAEPPDLGSYFIAEIDEGAAPRRLTPWVVPANPTPRLSPDGSKVAAHGPARNRGDLVIHVLDRENPGQSRIFGGDGECLQNPRWSADGRLIAAEDRLSGEMVVIQDDGTISDVLDCHHIRGQHFLEVWNFDIH